MGQEPANPQPPSAILDLEPGAWNLESTPCFSVPEFERVRHSLKILRTEDLEIKQVAVAESVFFKFLVQC